MERHSEQSKAVDIVLFARFDFEIALNGANKHAPGYFRTCFCHLRGKGNTLSYEFDHFTERGRKSVQKVQKVPSVLSLVILYRLLSLAVPTRFDNVSEN